MLILIILEMKDYQLCILGFQQVFLGKDFIF